jgi:hypothetical protein
MPDLRNFPRMRHPITIAASTLTIAALACTRSNAPGGAIILPLICAALMLVAPALDAAIFKRPALYRDMLRSPLTYLWLAFLSLLLVQWLNAGREALYDPTLQRWAYAPPAHPALPSAIHKRDALQMLAWFTPAAAISVALRAYPLSGRAAHRRLQLLIAPAALLAVASLGQWVGAKLGWIAHTPREGYFIWGFGYENHAGAFFILMQAAALHLLISPWCSHRGAREKSRPNGRSQLESWREATRTKRTIRYSTALHGLLTICCIIGAHLSEGRAAIILSWSLVLIAAAVFLRANWHRWHSTQRLQGTAIACITLLCVVFLIHGIFHDEINTELSTLRRKDNVGVIHQLLNSGLIHGRQQLRDITFELWKQAPWVGHGGWAGCYLIPLHANPGYTWNTGSANTHCDPLQILSEFGIIGFALLAAICVLLLRSPRRTPPILTTGLIALLLYSLIDLPFRHPAIIAAWFALASLQSSPGLPQPVRRSPDTPAGGSGRRRKPRAFTMLPRACFLAATCFLYVGSLRGVSVVALPLGQGRATPEFPTHILATASTTLHMNHHPEHIL